MKKLRSKIRCNMKGTELMSLRNHRSHGVNSPQAEPQSARQCFLLCKREERTRGAEPEMNRNGEEEMERTYALMHLKQPGPICQRAQYLCDDHNCSVLLCCYAVTFSCCSVDDQMPSD